MSSIVLSQVDRSLGATCLLLADAGERVITDWTALLERVMMQLRHVSEASHRLYNTLTWGSSVLGGKT